MASFTKIKKQNIAAGIILLGYGIWIFAKSFTFIGVGRSGEPGPRLLPNIIGIIIIFLSALLLLTTVLEQAKSKKTDSSAPPAPGAGIDKKSIVLTFVLFASYMFLLKPVGFIVSSAVYIFLQILVMSVQPSKKQLIVYAIVAIVVPVSTYLIFVYVFSLMLPAGILGLGA